MKELEYPFDNKYLLRKCRSMKRQLKQKDGLIKKNIAVLGGSTTDEICNMLELFLLDQGIAPVFYESEYGQYWEDAMFGNEKFASFAPDIIYIHTSVRNITAFPKMADDRASVDMMLENEYKRLEAMWDKLHETYHCAIIQNNFEYPFYRLMGNQDASDYHGQVNFVTRLNLKLYEYKQTHDFFFINDINYQAADYGLQKWADPFYWYAYKYALCMDAIPGLAFNISNIIKSIFGKNKKVIALDLDNTLWKGIVGDDGVENLVLGQETATGQAYTEFQQYLKKIKDRGVLLTVISKNEHENAIAGINHPEMILKQDDFMVIKANWEPKSQNLLQTAQELSLGADSFVFIDDNPAEREIIRQQIAGAGVPELEQVEQYIMTIDRGGYFEATMLSADDLKRNEMYKENLAREQQKQMYGNYEEYLKSLNMKAEIRHFEEVHLSRIAQLTNKTNQFNLTTVRYTKEELEQIAAREDHIAIYGRLEDCFGDNGIISIVAGHTAGDAKDELHIDLWLMSCRVLKRGMENAMMDKLAELSAAKGIKKMVGYYYPTAKNKMVADFYETQGFVKLTEDEEGNTTWVYDLEAGYQPKNQIIEVNGGNEA